MPGTADYFGEPTAVGAIEAFTRRVTIWLAVLTVGLAVLGAGVWITLSKQSDTAGKAADTARETSALAGRNCQNLKGLAGIERTFIQQQQQQTTALLKSGFTFGIPQDKLGPLIKASEANQQAFLNAFDALTLSNC